MEFRLMTYNIFGARLTDGRELAKSIKKYKPDFIGLQEVDRNTKRSKFRDVIQEMAQELGYNYYYFQKAMDFDNGEYGIAFISKYDVKFIYIHELPGNSKEKRQVLAAKLNLGRFNKKILVVNTHLDNKIMRKFLSRFGFKEKGLIKLTMKNILDDKERVAYELEVR